MANALDGIDGVVQLQHDAGFFASVFDARELSECEEGQVIPACRSLYGNLIPLTGKCDSMDQTDTAIADVPRGFHTRSSQYASAEPENESDDSTAFSECL